MFWAFIAIISVTLLIITLNSRGVARVIGGVLLAGLVVFGLLLRLGSKNETEAEQPARGRPTSPAVAITAMPLEAIEVAELQLTGGGAPFELRGEVRNKSDSMQVRSITLSIARRDCYEGALDPSGCVVLWEDQHWISLHVPPESARRFASSFFARTPIARVRGTLKDEFRVVAATGMPVED